MAVRRRMTITQIDAWSVLKFGFLLNLCLLAIALLGSVVVWFFVTRLGLIDQVCEIAEDLAFQSCSINGANLFRAELLLGLLWVIVQSAIYVFLAFLHNLLADLVGGLRVTVVDDSRVPSAPPQGQGAGVATQAMPRTDAVRAGAGPSSREGS